MNARLLGRHGVSMLAALGVLLAMPALLPALPSGLVLGLPAGIFVALLVGSYWFVLQLIPESRQRQGTRAA